MAPSTSESRSMKKLVLPASMATGASTTEKMQLHRGNKGRHPGVVDDWKDPDDTESISEKLKKKSQKKAEQVVLQEELRWEDVQQALVTNHPGRTKKKATSSAIKPSAKPRTDLSINSQTSILSTAVKLGSVPLHNIASTTEELHNDHECHLSTIKQMETSLDQAMLPVVGGADEGSGEDLDEYIPPAHDDSVKGTDHGNIASKVAQSGQQSKTASKVSARSTIANARFTNNGVAMPAITSQATQLDLQKPSQRTLKRKGQTVIPESEAGNAIFISDNENQADVPTVQASVSQEPPKKRKKKMSKAKAGKNSKAKPVSETAESPTNSGPLAANWLKKREHDKANSHHTEAVNDSLVQMGSMVDDDEDVKPEFVDIVKVPATATGIQVGTTTTGADAVTISKKGPASITARQAPLTVGDVQEAINLEFGPGNYLIAEKGMWMGLANYRMTDFHHDISIEAEKVVDVFIKDHSDQLSTLGQISQYINWLLTATSPRNRIQPSTPFMWQGLSADGTKRWGMFRHELIVRVMVEAHFMALPGTMDDVSTIAFPKGALLLAAQAVGWVLSMWTTGVLVNGSAPTFSQQNFDDVTEEYALSTAEHAKHGKEARKKTIKTKWVLLYLPTLETWTQDKWNDLLTDIRKAIETSTSKRKRKTSMSAHSASPDLIEEDINVVFKSDPPEPDSEGSSASNDSCSGSGEDDELENEGEDSDEMQGVIASGSAGSPGEELEGANSMMVIIG